MPKISVSVNNVPKLLRLWTMQFKMLSSQTYGLSFCKSSRFLSKYILFKYSSGEIPASLSSAMIFSSFAKDLTPFTLRPVMYNVKRSKSMSSQESSRQRFFTLQLLSSLGKKVRPDILSSSVRLTWYSFSWCLKLIGTFGTTKAPRASTSDEWSLLTRITL